LHDALICDWGSCNLPAAETQTSCLSLTGVITPSATFPLSCLMQRLRIAVAVGGNCTQVLYKRQAQSGSYIHHLALATPCSSRFIKQDPTAAISHYLAVTCYQFYNTNT